MAFVNKDMKSWAGCDGGGWAFGSTSWPPPGACVEVSQGRRAGLHLHGGGSGCGRKTSILSSACVGVWASAMDLEAKGGVWDSLPPVYIGARGIFEGFEFDFCNNSLKSRTNYIAFDGVWPLRWGAGDRDGVTACDGLCDTLRPHNNNNNNNNIHKIYIYNMCMSHPYHIIQVYIR